LVVYNCANYTEEQNTVAFADIPARAGETVVTLSGIRPGTYAIETFQDSMVTAR
jgi:hypothetical protein